MDDPQPLPQRGSSQKSLEMDILKLSARWEAQRTIRTGDTPGRALRKGACGAANGAGAMQSCHLPPCAQLPQHISAEARLQCQPLLSLPPLTAGPRPALAAIPPNVVAAAPNPFSLSAQRQKATRQQHQQPQREQQHQQQTAQQPSVRFAADTDSRRPGRGAGPEHWHCGTASAAATPTGAAPPATQSRLAARTTGGASGSPSPYVLFRGRLSFAAEADSGGWLAGCLGLPAPQTHCPADLWHASQVHACQPTSSSDVT